MKRTAKFLAILLAIVTVASAVSAFAFGEFKAEVEQYDKYGYYAYFDFENYDHKDHFAYFRSDAKNANGLACDPYGFLLNKQGEMHGTGSIVEEDGNTYYHMVKGSGSYPVLAVFGFVDENGNDALLGDSAEISFRLRMSKEQTVGADKKMSLVDLRRGDSNYGNRITHLSTDIYGNLYAQNGKQIYQNGDGKTVGGTGDFITISFRWYDVTNTYSVFVNGYAVAEAEPIAHDYRSDEKVVKTYDDDFNVESLKLKDVTDEGSYRAIELMRSSDAFAFDVDDVKLSRIETAQGGAVYYANSFDGAQDGISGKAAKDTYNFPNGSDGIELKTEDGNGYLYVPSGKTIALFDKQYQAFLQGNTVVEFSIKGSATHSSGKKSLIRFCDAQGNNAYKLLYVDSEGYLYTENADGARIEGYRLSEGEWLNVAVVAIKNMSNSGKFSTFSEANTKSKINDSYTFNYYINGNYVGASKADFIRFGNPDTWDYTKLVAASNYRYTITDYATTLDIEGLTLIDETTANHKIYKSVVDGVVTYYDVTLDENGNQTGYSAMVLNGKNTNADADDFRFFHDASFAAKIDNIKIYEGTAPESTYEAVNSLAGGTVINVDFSKFVFPVGKDNNRSATTKDGGSDVLGIFKMSGSENYTATHKDADGITIEKETTANTNYTAFNLTGEAWFDFFIPMAKKTDGGFDVTYTLETRIKNINFTNENAPEKLSFFSLRLEDEGGSNSQALITVDNECNLYMGGSVRDSRALYLNGEQAKLDNTAWNNLRVDLRFVKTAEGGALEASYYLGGQLLTLSDGSAAAKVTSFFGADLLGRIGTDHVRLRYFLPVSKGQNLAFDAKDFTIKANEKAVYTTVETEQADFVGNVTAIEFTVPKYTSDKNTDKYEALALVKSVGDTTSKLALVTVDPVSGKVYIGNGGLYYELCYKSGKAITVPADGLSMVVVYNDVDGLARYYVNGSAAYANLPAGFAAAAEVGVYDADFALIETVDSYGYVLFGGYGNDEHIMNEVDYSLVTDKIGAADNSTLIGFQEHTETNSIRFIAGINSVYYDSVGFEIEVFDNGVSRSVKTVSGNSVFDKVEYGDKEVSAKDFGYEYIVALSINDLPKVEDADRYILIRAYTEVGTTRYYDNNAKLVLSDDGSYFDDNGTVYKNDFNGLDKLPMNWKLVKNGGTATVELTSNGEIEFDATLADNAFYYLDQNVGKSYLFQFDFTVNGSYNNDAYIAPVFGYKDSGTFGYAYINMAGEQGAIRTVGEESKTYKTFTKDQLGFSFENGKTYTATLTVKGNRVALFINGSYIAECDVDANTVDGRIGICAKGVNLLIDNVIVKTGSYVEDSYLLHEENFNGIAALPEGWVVALGDDKSGAGVTEDGGLRLIQPTDNFMVAYYNTAISNDAYVLEAEFTVTDKKSDNGYFGFVYGLTDTNNFAATKVRFNGSGATEVRADGSWSNTAAFEVTGVTFELGKTYTAKVVVKGTTAMLYIDGALVATTNLPAGYTGGKIGFIASELNLNVDNLKVTTAPADTVAPYSQNFNGLTALPTEWKPVNTTSGKSGVELLNNTKASFVSQSSEFTSMWLKDGVKQNGVTVNDYVIEANVTITKDTGSGYIALTFRQHGAPKKNASDSRGHFIIAGTRPNDGAIWIQGDNSGSYKFGGETIKEAGVIKVGETYTLKIECQGTAIKYYINGELKREGTISSGQANFKDGSVGILSKGLDFDLNSFTVTAVDTGEVLYESDFSSSEALNADWAFCIDDSANGSITTSGREAMYIYGADQITHAYLDGGKIYDEYTLTVDLTKASADNNWAAILAKYNDSKNFIGIFFKSTGQISYECYINGSWKNARSNAATFSDGWSNGQTIRVEVVCKDGYLTVYADGKQMSDPYPIPTELKTGSVAFAAKYDQVYVDNVVIEAIAEETPLAELYTQNFDVTPKVPTEWTLEAGAQATEVSIAVKSTDNNNGMLSASAMDSELTVIALDKLLDYKNFVYEADISMVERANNNDASYYMGPVFGLQGDGSYGVVALKVTDGAYDIQAWQSTEGQWKAYDNGHYGNTALNTTYKFKLVGSGGYLTLYINGVEEAKCKLDDLYLNGGFGIAFRNSEITVDNVKIYKELKLYDLNEAEYTAVRVRVATFNIGDFSTDGEKNGLGNEGAGTETTRQQYIDVLKKVDADIWAFQEDAPLFDASSGVLPDGSTGTTAYDAIYSEIYQNSEGKKDHHDGITDKAYNNKSFLSSYELLGVEQVKYSSVYNYYDHPWFLAGKVNIEGVEVCLITVHFDWKDKYRRAQQIADVLAYAENHDYCIILGDINSENYISGDLAPEGDPDHINEGSTSMWQIDWQKFIDAGYTPANGGQYGTYGTLVSHGALKTKHPWDNIFVSSKNIKIKNVKVVVESWMNDHAIVVSDIEIYIKNTENKIPESSDSGISGNGLDTLVGVFKSEPSVVISATEDTYIHGGNPSTSYGDAKELQVKGTSYSSNELVWKNDEYHRRSFVRFDISKLKSVDLSKVEKITLELNCTGLGDYDNATTYYIKEISSSWSGSSTYSDLKRASATNVATMSISKQGIVSVDITAYIKNAVNAGKTTVSFVIDGDSNKKDSAYFASIESGNGPAIKVFDVGHKDYSTDLEYTIQNPWQVAMDSVNTWTDRWVKIQANGTNDATAIQVNNAEYNRKVGAATVQNTNGSSTVYTNYATRTVASLKSVSGFAAAEEIYDEYGGLVISDEMKAELGIDTSKKFFHTMKIDGRWWTIDPLGNPFFRTACVSISYGSSPNQEKLSDNKYGSVSNWALAATQEMKELGFNSTGGWSDIKNLINTDKPLVQTSIIYTMAEYAKQRGLNVSDSGSTEFLYNVIPAFDPAFKTYAESLIRKDVVAYKDSPYIYGWMSDNELPGDLDMLDNALSLDYTDERFVYSYATAWTFMYVKTGMNENVSRADVTDELRREYRAMVYDKYYEVVTELFEKYAPNHMYLGCRLLTDNYQDEYVMRVSGYWCDIVTFNYYYVWTPEAEFLTNIQNWLNTPFVITEWYAKGMDACETTPGLTNESGVGWTVKTQQDRGLFYQNYALMLLECKGCVGFDWFKYWDNDPSDTTADLSNRDSNKGILDNNGNMYTDLTNLMKELNTQKYSLIQFFDSRNANN